MNFFVISGEFPPFAGGAGTYCNYLIKALAARGHKITLITKHYKENVEQERKIDLALSEQNIKCIRMPYFKFTFIFSWYRIISNYLKQHNDFDFVILNGNIAQLVCRKPKLKKLLGKYITVQHGISAYDLLKKTPLLPLLGAKKQLDCFFKNAVANIAISQNLKEKLEKQLKMPNLYVILNCIDNEIFNCTVAENKNTKVLQITTASRLIPAKNTISVVRLFAKLKTEFPNIKLNIAGTGSETENLKNEVEKLQISSSVNFTGLLNAKDLCRLYQESDIFILLSFYESFALVYLEANACSVPVIGSDVGGIREAIEDGVSGFVVPLDDENIIYEKTKLLLSDAELRKKMGNAGKKRVDEKFSLDTLGKNFEKLLNELK